MTSTPNKESQKASEKGATSNRQGAKYKKSHRLSGKFASNLTGAVTVPGRKKKCETQPDTVDASEILGYHPPVDYGMK